MVDVLPLLSPLSFPAKAGNPVRRGFSVQSQRLWNTGSPAFAGDDSGACYIFINACRSIFPVPVFGSSSMNLISRGYL